MESLRRIEQIIEPSIADMGYELVRVQMTRGTPPTLQVMAERRDRGPMTVEDCADISRHVSALLDVEDPIEEAYMLEVSSPGIDRPLTRLADFDRFSGFEAKVELRVGIDGRKRFRGRLTGCDGQWIGLHLDDAPEGADADVRLPFDDVYRAKLVLTDALIAAHERAGADPSGADISGGMPA